ncbi:MAG: DNA-binding transcriptional regulator, MarR family [Belnapia sp.]|nr:DNA-binding transcriptional regulator, MarR family [Belnapia sp.]
MTAEGGRVHARIVPLARAFEPSWALEAELLAGLAATDRAALHRLLDGLDLRLIEMGAGPDAAGFD